MKRIDCKGCEDARYEPCYFYDTAEIVTRFKYPLRGLGLDLAEPIEVQVPNCYAQPEFIYLEKRRMTCSAS